MTRLYRTTESKTPCLKCDKYFEFMSQFKGGIQSMCDCTDRNIYISEKETTKECKHFKPRVNHDNIAD